jgi:hypothetical protein
MSISERERTEKRRWKRKRERGKKRTNSKKSALDLDLPLLLRLEHPLNRLVERQPTLLREFLAVSSWVDDASQVHERFVEGVLSPPLADDAWESKRGQPVVEEREEHGEGAPGAPTMQSEMGRMVLRGGKREKSETQRGAARQGERGRRPRELAAPSPSAVERRSSGTRTALRPRRRSSSLERGRRVSRALAGIRTVSTSKEQRSE